MSETIRNNTLVASTAVPATIDIDVDLSKRNFLKVGGLAAVGTLAIGSAGCDKEDIDFYVSTLTGALEELKPLLPNQATLISKAVSIAKSFNSAWQADKFASASAIFENLITTFNEIITAAGLNVSDTVKVVVAVAGVALRAIAVLVKQQAQDPAVAAAVRTTAETPSGSRQKSLVEKLADPAAIDVLFRAAKPAN